MRHSPLSDAAAAYRRHMEETTTARMLARAALPPPGRPAPAPAPEPPLLPRRWSLVALPGIAGADDDAARGEECSVCLNAFDDETALACGHSFCADCLRGALAKAPLCPLCRRDATAFAALRGWDAGARPRPEARLPQSFDAPAAIRGAVVRAGCVRREGMVVFFVRVDGRCAHGDAILRSVTFQFSSDGGEETCARLDAAPYELPLAAPPPGSSVAVVARIEPRAGLGIDARPEFLPLRSDGPGAVLELRASATSRRSRAVSLPGTMSETLAELSGLRATNRATHASLAGTVRRIQTQASELRAKLRESRRTPSLAEIVALNSLPPRPAPG